MKEAYDFKKEWPKIKKQLVQFGQEAMILAKKGEEKIIKFSKESKLHLDATAREVKKEHLYYEIGKAYVKAGCPGEKNNQLNDLIGQLRRIKKEKKTIKAQLKKSRK